MGLDHAPEGIRINAVCPGEVHTQMVDDMLKTMGLTPEGLAKGIPMRRLAKPSEVANCVLFLASDLASYVTATCFSVDGGNDAIGGPYP
jgi:NAD(P)-dependent dehydrogenase (short-subunit alcohol dehydrogenase family)